MEGSSNRSPDRPIQKPQWHIDNYKHVDEKLAPEEIPPYEGTAEQAYLYLTQGKNNPDDLLDPLVRCFVLIGQFIGKALLDKLRKERGKQSA